MKFAIEAAKMMRGADEDILLVAAGSSNYPLVTSRYDPKDGWTDWRRRKTSRLESLLLVNNQDMTSFRRQQSRHDVFSAPDVFSAAQGQR